MSMEHLVEWELARETELFGGNLPQCHFVSQKSRMIFLGIESGAPRWEAWDMSRPLDLLTICTRFGKHLTWMRCIMVFLSLFMLYWNGLWLIHSELLINSPFTRGSVVGWLHYATSRKVVGSIPEEVIEFFFNLLIPSTSTVALGSTQPLTEMSTGNPHGG
jgi:hypothetical protein